MDLRPRDLLVCSLDRIRHVRIRILFRDREHLCLYDGLVQVVFGEFSGCESGMTVTQRLMVFD